ncbi:MAG: hypothetical protein HY924_04940 [Elusimicrobia bacterium]|nr:hypothetical protein [Elusimicrobiota bacterium]
MRSPLYSILFSLLFISFSVQAAPGPKTAGPKPKGAFGVKYIGEPGSDYSQPTGAVADALETSSRQEGGQGTFGPIDHQGNPRLPTVAEAPRDAVASQAAIPFSGPTAAETPQVFAPKPRGVSATAAVKEAAQQPEDRARYSLWDGLQAPLELPAAKVKDVGPDAASKIGRQDYQTHILAAGVPRPRPFLVEPFSVQGGEGKVGELFVRFELDLAKVRQQAASPASAAVSPENAAPSASALAPGPAPAAEPSDPAKIALAELGRVAGFRADSREGETMRDAVADRVSVRGWIPSDRIAMAMRLPGVSMLEIEPQASRPSYGAQAATDILIGIRVSKGQGATSPDLGAGSSFAGLLARLRSDTGFALKKTIGYQEVPGGRDAVVVVSGSIPVRNISKALAFEGVVKIASSPDAGMPSPSPSVPQRRSFMSFVLSRSPLLVAATLIVLLSPLSLGLFRFLQVLSPYRQQ